MTHDRPTPRITDEAVRALPIAAGRTELLEEIMSTPVLAGIDLPRRRQAVPKWLLAGVSAAAVGVIAILPATGGGSDPSPGPFSADGAASVVDSRDHLSAVAAPVVPRVPGGRYVGIEVDGWNVEALNEANDQLTILWNNGGAWLEANRYPATLYGAYYRDRSAELPETSTELLERAATEWSYTATDHTTITAAQDGFFFEVRAVGLSQQQYHDLLTRLVQTDEKGFYEGLPAGTVTPANRAEAIAELLRGVKTPDGFAASNVELRGFNDPYSAAAEVAGAVGCSWLDVYESGSPEVQEEAVAVLQSSRDWPLFDLMDGRGDYPENFWATTDRLQAGQHVDDLRAGIGC